MSVLLTRRIIHTHTFFKDCRPRKLYVAMPITMQLSFLSWTQLVVAEHSWPKPRASFSTLCNVTGPIFAFMINGRYCVGNFNDSCLPLLTARLWTPLPSRSYLFVETMCWFPSVGPSPVKGISIRVCVWNCFSVFALVYQLLSMRSQVRPVRLCFHDHFVGSCLQMHIVNSPLWIPFACTRISLLRREIVSLQAANQLHALKLANWSCDRLATCFIKPFMDNGHVIGAAYALNSVTCVRYEYLFSLNSVRSLSTCLRGCSVTR